MARTSVWVVATAAAVVAAAAWTGSAYASGSSTPAPRPAATRPPAPLLKAPKVGPAPAFPGARALRAQRAQAAVTATNVTCGETLTTSVTLNGDLTCSGGASGYALRIAGASVVLNLGGYTVQSSDSSTTGDGVLVQANSDTVENGTVTGFYYGVAVFGSREDLRPTSDKVTKIRATYDDYGIADGGAKTTISANTAYVNSEFGIATEATGATVSGNIATSNTYDGIAVASGASGVVVSGNQADSNGVGIYIGTFAAGTTLTKNVADYNQDDGMANQSTNTVDGGGNLAKGNDTDFANQVPEECYAVACN